MKQFILFLFVLLPFCVTSQVNETFDGPEIDSANPWRVDSAGFFVKDGRLQFDASRRAKGIHTIKLDISYNVDGMEWMFDVSFSYKPTNNNHVRIFVYATGEPTNVAYFIQVGHNEGNVSLYSWPSSSDPQRVIKGRGSILTKGSNSVRVKLTLESNSKLVLYTRLDTESCFHKEGECKVVSLGVRKGGVLNLQCRYQAASMDNMITSFVNIIISDHVTPTPIEPEEEPGPSDEEVKTFSLQDLEQESATELLMVFDDPVDPAQYQISLSEKGDADEVYISEDEKVLKTAWNEAMLKGKTYTLSYSGIFNKSGGECKGDTTFVSAYGKESQEPDNSGTVLINEIMADPNGLKDLEKTEYIELFNASGKELSLKGWQLIYGKEKPKTIGSVSVPAASYLVLYRSGREIKIDGGGIAVPMDNFPSQLANAGKELQLWDASGKVADKVTYAKASPGKSWERSASGWHLSVDPRGGTPGSVNSSPGNEEEPPVDPDEPDVPDNPADPAIPVTADPVQPGEIIINELLPDPYAGGSEYIELYNRSDHPLSLSALSVAIRKSDGTLSTRYPLASIPHHLKAKSYLLLTKNLEGVASFYYIADPTALCELAKLPILANTSSTLVLFRAADETVIDEVAYSSKWHAHSVKSQKGVALERIDPDAATQNPANWTSASETAGYGTPGYQNSQYKNVSSGGATGIEPPVWIEESGSYTISYLLDRPGYNCRALVFNTSGLRVAEIANHELLGTSGEITWSGIASNGSPLQTGVYIFYAEVYHPEGVVKRFKKAFLIR